MTPAQMETFRSRDERAARATNGTVRRPDAAGRASCRPSSTRVPFDAQAPAPLEAPRDPGAGAACRSPTQPAMSTQPGFGQILDELARGGEPLADRIVTTSPTSRSRPTSAPWVNRRGLFARAEHGRHVPRASASPRPATGTFSPKGQHIELGIAEMNLFLLLSALGLSHSHHSASGCCRSARSTIRSSRAASMR